mgnify:CR=1 FL=1
MIDPIVNNEKINFINKATLGTTNKNINKNKINPHHLEVVNRFFKLSVKKLYCVIVKIIFLRHATYKKYDVVTQHKLVIVTITLLAFISPCERPVIASEKIVGLTIPIKLVNTYDIPKKANMYALNRKFL